MLRTRDSEVHPSRVNALKHFSCRHIPLDEIGETVDSLYRTGTNEEIEQTLQGWLLKTIRQFEEPSEQRSFEKAA